ncbi:MAG: sensor domain-containing diguanylate cyclase [Clostridiaceae bacterium]|nr:sensor domain-containing diguanylate cyclase [Clostridiaceae bacterium]
MLRKFPTIKNASFALILIISVFMSMLISIPTYIIFEWYSQNNPIKGFSLLMFVTAFTGVLYFVIFIISGALLKKLSEQHAHAMELKNFKDFTDVLYRSSSEIEVYEALYNFVRNMHLVSHVSLYYRNDRTVSDVSWQRITDERLPLCTMEPRNCPLVKYGRECSVKNIAMDITCAYQLPEHKSGSYICLPITDGNMTLGILQLYSKSKYFFDDLIVSKIKSYIEVAKPIISSSRTMHQLSKKASTDKLTKLYNRSFLEPYLENQLEATSLSRQKLSVIMMDIDDFKKINDTYGHASGDLVLSLFSQVILGCLRRTDLVARYGGEEFIAILPSTDTDTAVSIAERIRETISIEPMPTVGDQRLPHITCSLGVSTYPVFADNKTNLVKTADIALYKAKRSGKNCVKVYSRDMTV